MPTFALTDGEVQKMNYMSAGSAMGSFFLCSMILVVSFMVYKCPPARPTLNRISFRLLIWTMVVELFYDVAYTVCVLLKEDDNRGACTASVVGIFMFVGITNYLVTCVALNLCLVLVFGVNVVKLEKYYVIGSFAVGIFVPIVPATLGTFGWDPLLSVCWVTIEDPNSRIVTFVMALYLWQLLSCLAATIFVAITIGTLYRQGRQRERSLNSGTRVGQVTLKEQVSSGGDSSDNGTKQGSKQGSKTGTTTKAQNQRSMSTRTFRDQFISVAIRVSAYPVALIIVNAFIAFADLTISVHGSVDSRGLYAIYVIYYFLYGARGGIFAAIALFVDPSLTRGVSIMWKYWRNGGHVDTSMPVSSGQRDTQFAGVTSTVHGGVLVTVELQEFNSVDELPKIDHTDPDHQDHDDEEEDIGMDDKIDSSRMDGSTFTWKGPKEDVEASPKTDGRPSARFAKKENKRALARQRKIEAQAAFEQATAQL
ncbi:hypothetical protein BD626DRAFT_253251 [Schizophyllum amplum]|uniref:G-protein coupled receptors family 2 profile 2 domain-containing protein n=1 Tax=Schizophyllum amplum TaxID=97359 RepID=A0A550CI62_9AGAR|nr:hypothetical protein BD626DRAFT_253251 [Auriculariopsis ampla]